MSIEGDTYDINSHRYGPFDPVLLSGLPSSETALHYLQNLEFRTRPLYQLLDQAQFREQMRHFYLRPVDSIRENTLWFCHYLVVMAFGKVIVSRCFAQKNTFSAAILPGIELFERALSLLPDATYLCKHAVESSELLCCIAMYLHSLDHRDAAQVHVSPCFIGQFDRAA